LRIEAVTVCVEYSDFLAWALLWNKKLFDDWVVVTSTSDRQTSQVCAYHHVRCIQTDQFYAGDRAFNKGAGINAGLAALKCTDWVMHLDADILLPPRARDLMERAALDPQSIYGLDRMMCKSFDDWTKFIASPEVQHSDEVFVTANAFPLGSRVAKTDQDGYLPIGYAQLWNAGKTCKKTYPDGHGTSARADMLFAQAWPRSNRHLIPEIVAIHLESEAAPNGTNWRGRRTAPFGPCDGAPHGPCRAY
jgi:hypothetical protein